MDYFPLFARLEGLPCLVVGAGNVAARKAKQLLRAGAKVSINAPRIGDELLSLANTGAVDVIGGEFSTELVANFWLVIAATDDADLNKSIALATTFSSWAESLTSQGTAMASTPNARAFSAVSSIWARVRALQTTWAPASAKARAQP